MSLPENRLSLAPHPSMFLDGSRASPFIDYEMGGTDLQQPGDGLFVKLWTLKYERNSGDVVVSAPGSPTTVLFNRPNITEVSLAFDQNMNPFVAFVQAGQAKFWWYDPTVPGQVFAETLLGAASSPRCSLDDKRKTQVGASDIILAYVRANSLYYRLQRERYLTEHLLISGGVTKLFDVGMNAGLRFQFAYEGPGRPDHPFLADVVLRLCQMGGLAGDAVDVSELYDTRVIGYKCNTDDGLNKRIDALRDVFFFDKSEVDKQMFFPRRGREVAARIPYVDLVADEPSALQKTLIQEADLPKSVSVNHLDPAGAFAKNTQVARRRSNLVSAKKELKFESEVVLTADQGMTAATIKLKSAWHEQVKFKFATTIKYSFLVPTDVAEVEDKQGVWHRIRVTERNEDGSVIAFEGVQDAGQDVYATLGVGHSLPPPVSTTPGLVGETRLEILNIAVLRDQDDELGVYVAVCGESEAWSGTELLISTNDGVTYFPVLTTGTPATVGDTETALLADISAEYQDNQSVIVVTNFGLESVSYDEILNNLNRCVIGDEVMQFQTATFLGMVGTKFRYRLGGLVRGRYNTAPEAWPAATRFVLLDSSVLFVQAQQWMIGRELLFKPVSNGATEDETVPTGYDYDTGINQTEWPPTDVAASRDGSDNVTVTWNRRPRLGVETNPYNSKHMTGHKVKFSDGFEAIVGPLDITYTRSTTPAAVTVQVCGVNDITGDGEFSGAIAT